MYGFEFGLGGMFLLGIELEQDIIIVHNILQMKMHLQSLKRPGVDIPENMFRLLKYQQGLERKYGHIT